MNAPVVATPEPPSGEAGDRGLDLKTQILDHIAVGVILVRCADHSIIYANEWSEQMFGYEAGELIGRQIAVLSDPTEASRYAAADDIHRACRADGRWIAEVRTIRKDGTTFWSRVNISVSGDHDSSDTWIAMYQDITERRAVNSRLRQSHALSHAVLEAIPDAIMLADPHGRVLAANRLMAERLGTSVSNLVGQNSFDFYAGPIVRSRKEAGAEAMHSRTTIVARDKRAGRFLENRITPVSDHTGQVTSLAIISRDVTEIHEQDERLRLITDSVPAAIAHFDVNERHTFTNRHYRQWFCGPDDTLRGRQLQEALGAAYRAAAPHVETALAGQSTHFEHEIRTIDGQRRSMDVRYVPDYAEDASVRGFFALSTDVTELKAAQAQLVQAEIERRASLERELHDRKAAEQQIQTLAYYDSLTGLPNRRRFMEQLQRLLEAAKRRDFTVSLLFLDLDHFKAINDGLGHSAGDALLREVGARIVRSLRQSDTVARAESSEWLARLGGDEFTVLLSELSHTQDAGVVARRLLEAISTPLTIEGHDVFPKASIGIAVFPADGQDAETLLKNADTAMYHSKNGGRHGFEFYGEAMTVEPTKRFRLGTRLHQALERHEFVLHYQPLRDARTGTLTGAEALLRWNDPEEGPIAPGDFIPIAEDTGLIVSIGTWVLRTACTQARTWHEAGCQRLRVAVNVSPQQLRQRSWIHTVTRILEDTRLDPTHLELELTESAILQHDAVTVDNLQALHAMGIGLALDDFGTGSSSLAYLQRFPIGRVKIDRSFVNEIGPNAAAAPVVEAILALAKSLNLNVVAEGVETEYQAEFLRERGCDELQGNLLSPAVPEHEFHRFLVGLQLCECK